MTIPKALPLDLRLTLCCSNNGPQHAESFKHAAESRATHVAGEDAGGYATAELLDDAEAAGWLILDSGERAYCPRCSAQAGGEGEGHQWPAGPAELPGWGEVEAAIDAGVAEVACTPRSAVGPVATRVRPPFDRLLAACAEARAGRAAAEAREGELRNALARAQNQICTGLSRCPVCLRFWQDDEPVSHEARCPFALLAAPAPPPSALLAFLHRLEHDEQFADDRDLAIALRDAIGLPPAEDK